MEAPGAPEVAMGVLEMAVMDQVRGVGKVGEVVLRGQILKICCDVVRTGYVPCFPKIWVAKGLKHPSLKIQILSWIGEDSESDRYLNLIKQEGVNLKGTERIPQMRMPVSMMIYEIDGSSTCLYDSGGVDYPSLSNSQFKQLRNSEWLCLTVGPWENTKKSFIAIAVIKNITWILGMFISQ